MTLKLYDVKLSLSISSENAALIIESNENFGSIDDLKVIN